MQTTFLRVLSDEEKGTGLQQSVEQINQEGGDKTFLVDPDSFHQVPGSPFGYWVSERIRKLFVELPPFESEGRTVKQGLATADDFRFVRAWWEVSPEKILDAQNGPDWREDMEQFQEWCKNRTKQGKKWVPFAKGGEYSPFYADIHLVINWSNLGQAVKAYIASRYPYLKGNWAWVVKNTEYYFRPGITWTQATTSRLSPRALPAGAIFSHRGPAAFSGDENLLQILAVMNSDTYEGLVNLQLGLADIGRRSYEVGVIQRTPIPRLSPSLSEELDNLAKNEFKNRLQAASTMEESVAFGGNVGSGDHINYYHTNIPEPYGINDRDKYAIEEILSSSSAPKESYFATDECERMHRVFSLLLGYCLGRWSLRKSSTLACDSVFSQKALPEVLLARNDIDSKTQRTVVCPFDDGILIDDEGHERDVITIMPISAKLYADCLSTHPPPHEDRICKMLGVGSLREYLRKPGKNGFWDRHIKQYSKSRRKAPIYWQLSIPSSQYSAWLYYHRFDKDTLFKVLSEHVVPKVQAEERKLDMLRTEYGPKPTTGQSEEISEQEDLVEELRWMREELEMVAPLWDPDLDDGVELNFALLWRLVPQNRSWQKHLKKRWDELCSGKYDWSRIAMRLWPERAVQACLQDRSYAIAHGLEDEFWVEGESGWRVRDLSEEDIERIISERSSKPVQDALERLLSAPPPLKKRKGRRR